MNGVKGLLVGILFTILYASGAVVMKIGLLSAPALTLATIRFISAALLLMIFIYVFQKGKYPFPKKDEWIKLFLLGLMNTAFTLGLGLWALRTVSSGLFNLFVPINPFLVAIVSWLFMKKSIQKKEWTGMVIAAAGLFVATYPSLENSHSSLSGLIFLALAMVSSAIGSVFYKKFNLKLPNLVINSWQLLFGGILLIIPMLLMESEKPITVDYNFIGYLIWSILILSISTMLIWFHLLKQDAIKANNWLFLTPIAGYGLSYVFLGEPITIYEVMAVILVVYGLYLSGNFKFSHSNSKTQLAREMNKQKCNEGG